MRFPKNNKTLWEKLKQRNVVSSFQQIICGGIFGDNDVFKMEQVEKKSYKYYIQSGQLQMKQCIFGGGRFLLVSLPWGHIAYGGDKPPKILNWMGVEKPLEGIFIWIILKSPLFA